MNNNRVVSRRKRAARASLNGSLLGRWLSFPSLQPRRWSSSPITAFETGLGQGLEKVRTVHIGEEDAALVAIGIVHDVVNGPRRLDSDYAWHKLTLLPGTAFV